MFIIRASQMETLRADVVERLAARLVLHLEALGYAGPARELVDYALDNASEFGLPTERALLRLTEALAACFAAPQAAIELPVPALSILLRHGMAPDEKLLRFEKWVRENAS
jgi:hypothetical protein